MATQKDANGKFAPIIPAYFEKVDGTPLGSEVGYGDEGLTPFQVQLFQFESSGAYALWTPTRQLYFKNLSGESIWQMILPTQFRTVTSLFSSIEYYKFT